MSVCAIAEQRLGSEALPRLIRVGLTVGDDAGIEPANLEFCLEALLASPPFTGARAVITRRAGDDLHVDYLEVDDGRTTD